MTNGRYACESCIATVAQEDKTGAVETMQVVANSGGRSDGVFSLRKVSCIFHDMATSCEFL